MPVEIEWALDDAGFKLLQARPLHVEPARVPDEIWLQHPGLSGHPAGIGWGTGRAVVVNCECELARVAPGDILVTRVAGPALEPRAAARRRRGGRARRLDLASRLARARARHPDGARRARCDAADSRRRAGRGRRRRRHRALDRVMAHRVIAGARLRHPAGGESALARLRGIAEVTVNPDSSRVIAKDKLIAGARGCDILFSLLHDPVDRAVIAANPKLRAITSMSITPDNIDVAEATRAAASR